MGGEHRCPVCQATFTRPQHVARHMRSHTGDRPYKCTHCGDQFARSDLLSRHVSKCHPGAAPISARALSNVQAQSDSDLSSSGGRRTGGGKDTSGKKRKNSALSASRATTSKQSCDQCVMGSLPCDGSNPCGKCIIKKLRCTYVKFHRQTAPVGPGHRVPASSSSNASASTPAPYLSQDSASDSTRPDWQPPSYGGLHSQSAAHHDPRMYAARQHAMLQDSPRPIHLDLETNEGTGENNGESLSSRMNYNLGLAPVPPPFSFSDTSSASGNGSRPSTSHFYEDTTSLSSLASLSSLSPPLPLPLITPQPQPRAYPTVSTQDIFLRPTSTQSSGSGGSGGSTRSRLSASPRISSQTAHQVFDNSGGNSPQSTQFAFTHAGPTNSGPFRYGVNAPQPAWMTQGGQMFNNNNMQRRGSIASDYDGSSSGYSEDGGYNHYDSRPSSAYDSRPSSSASHTSASSRNPVGGSFDILSLGETSRPSSSSSSTHNEPPRDENATGDSAPFFTSEAMRMPPADPNATPMPPSIANLSSSQAQDAYPGRGRVPMHLDFGRSNNLHHQQTQYLAERPGISRYPSGRSMSVSGYGYASNHANSNSYEAPAPAPMQSSTPGRESETRELREFWKQYMRTPLTGPEGGSNGLNVMNLSSGNLNVGRIPPVPTLSPLRGASSSTDDPMDGTNTMSMSMNGSSAIAGAMGDGLGLGLGMMSPRGRARVNSMPSGKTPVVEAGEWANVRFPPAGMMHNPQLPHQQSLHHHRSTIHGSADDLRSYEAAVLARKAPTTLNLVPKRRRGPGTPEEDSGV